MVDLYFADQKDLKNYRCDQCPEIVKRQRKCEMEGFENTPGLKQVDEYGIKINFCPGKATWFSETNKLFSDCFVAIHSGFLPKSGGLENQDAKFADIFPDFVERWEYRKKVRLWSDVHEFAGKCFEAIGKMFGGK